MNLVLVSDVFGLTCGLRQLAHALSGCYGAIDIVDPYGGKDRNFSDEDEAYGCFTSTVGLERYTESLARSLRGREHFNQVLLGFSVGASAIWILSSRLRFFSNTRGICFYGSQLRNFTGITPTIELDLYFADFEPTHDVDELHDTLANTPRVSCHKTAFSHGFMNEHSSNFDPEGYRRYLPVLRLASTPS